MRLFLAVIFSINDIALMVLSIVPLRRRLSNKIHSICDRCNRKLLPDNRTLLQNAKHFLVKVIIILLLFANFDIKTFFLSNTNISWNKFVFLFTEIPLDGIPI